VHHKLLFCSNPKALMKIPLAFCRGNQGDANIWVVLQEHVIPAALYTGRREWLGLVERLQAGGNSKPPSAQS